MAETKKEPAKRTFEVLISFSGLDLGDRFTSTGDAAWEEQHVQSGYLREVTEGVADVRGEAGQG
jgi:hypothetical protein